MSLKDALPLAGLLPAAPAVANVIPKAQTEMVIPAAHPKGKLYRWTRLHYSETVANAALQNND